MSVYEYKHPLYFESTFTQMHDHYKIEGTEHAPTYEYLDDPNWCPDFQPGLARFKKQVIEHVDEVDKGHKGKTYVHFGDGDYYFLKQIPLGSANPGKRNLSLPYHLIDIEQFRKGWTLNDYHFVEHLEKAMPPRHIELYPQLKIMPTEYLYGLTMSRWFMREFKGRIGLIGAGAKIDLIQELMKHKEYQDYLGLEKFNDYIKIPQKFACDYLDKTIQMVKEQLEKADPETRVFLFGVGHVKSGLVHHLPSFKNAIYLDVGAGIDAIAGVIDPERPYAKAWVNHKLREFDYSTLDLLQYDSKTDKTSRIL